MQTTIPEGTAVSLPYANSLIQNLGPGVLYVDTNGAATEDNGVKVDVGQAISLTGTTGASGFALGADCDVRIAQPATGLHR